MAVSPGARVLSSLLTALIYFVTIIFLYWINYIHNWNSSIVFFLLLLAVVYSGIVFSAKGTCNAALKFCQITKLQNLPFGIMSTPFDSVQKCGSAYASQLKWNIISDLFETFYIDSNKVETHNCTLHVKCAECSTHKWLCVGMLQCKANLRGTRFRICQLS